jgi:hypothetical protein
LAPSTPWSYNYQILILILTYHGYPREHFLYFEFSDAFQECLLRHLDWQNCNRIFYSEGASPILFFSRFPWTSWLAYFNSGLRSLRLYWKWAAFGGLSSALSAKTVGYTQTIPLYIELGDQFCCSSSPLKWIGQVHLTSNKCLSKKYWIDEANSFQPRAIKIQKKWDQNKKPKQPIHFFNTFKIIIVISIWKYN